MALAGLLYAFKGDGYTMGLIVILGVAGLVSFLLAIVSGFGVRKVKSYNVACPYCEQINVLTEKPNAAFACIHCARVIPVDENGTVMPVFQVRCGYCNSLNYYNEKSEALICEVCDREIPISTNAETTRNLPRSFTIHDDENLYELVLVEPGNKTEEVIKVLQQMLALNRSQVKLVIADAPVTLLTGITRKKAEMLQIQLGVHDALAEFKPIETTQPKA